MANDSNDGQPTLDKLTAEGLSPRKCIASGTDYGSAPKASSSAKPKGALASVKMKGGRY